MDRSLVPDDYVDDVKETSLAEGEGADTPHISHLLDQIDAWEEKLQDFKERRAARLYAAADIEEIVELDEV